MSEFSPKRIGDELWLRLDPDLMLCCRNVWRGDKGAYHALFLATQESTGLVSWGNVQLASGPSRAVFLKTLREDGITVDLPKGRLSRACLLIDKLEREGTEPAPMRPRKPSPDSWLVPGWMPLHGTTILYGPGGTGKSLLGLYFGVCALSGRMCGPWGIAPVGKVLYLDWEEADAVPHEERLHGILGPGGFADLGDRFLYRTMKAPLSDGIERLRYLVDKHEVDLVIVDSLSAASGGEVEGAEAALRTLTALRSLSRCSVLVIGHVNALGVTQTEGIPKLYGSIFNTNLARATIYLAEENLSEQEKILTAQLPKHNRGGSRRPVGFRLVFSDDPASTDMLVTANDPDLSALPHGEQILAFLKECPLGKETVTAIAAGTGIDVAKVKVNLHRLKKRNKVVSLTVTAGGRGNKGEWGLVDTKRNSYG